MTRLDFEDTYDGLGDQLDESNDAFNDDTFGGEDVASGAVGKDFDFFGQTAKVADAIEEEHMRFDYQQSASKTAPARAPEPPKSSFYSQSTKPAYTGYEKYKDEPVPELQADADLWGVTPKKPPKPAATTSISQTSGRKVMSLEEVEASLRAQAKKPAPQPSVQPQTQTAAPAGKNILLDNPDFLYARLAPSQPKAAKEETRGQAPATAHHAQGQPSVTILQRPQNVASKHAQPASPAVPSPIPQHQPQQLHGQKVQPTQILQNTNRLSGDASRMGAPMQPMHPLQGSMPHQFPMMGQPPQMMPPMSEEEKMAFMEQEAKRAKRNHKIHLLSKDNGLMTPQDKNFITRIQLQQLVSATGNPNDQSTDAALDEDFYYQVHNQIRGMQRQNPNQPLNNFAQTYLYQTGSRQGGTRRQARGPENHVQRMEQQVQRAVEAAKNKPKNKQLIIEGSLGKISFSNSKTPKPLLNIKRTESSTGDGHRQSPSQRQGATGIDTKSVLRSIEDVYATLMKLEDHDRKPPPPPSGPDDQAAMQQIYAWQGVSQSLGEQLWRELKVHAPIGATSVHPFIAFLSHTKGKKAIPRVFRHISMEQRATIMTIIVYHLDQLDVIRGAQPKPGERINAATRENIELFSLTVMPSLFSFLNEAAIDIVTGVLSLIVTQTNVDVVAKSRVGISMLTMILSRAELIRQSGEADEKAWAQW